MLNPIRTLTLAALTLALSAAATNAMADTQWQKEHPRREEVNNRLANQDKRIHQERKEGEITKGQAKQLHREDHAIRKEERTMASTNNGQHHEGRAARAESAGKSGQQADRQVAPQAAGRRERSALRSRRLP